MTDDAHVLTYWWADNFNQTLESLTGHGVIDSTHIVEFSEQSESTTLKVRNISIARSRRRSLVPIQQTMPSINVDKKKEPQIISKDVPMQVRNEINEEVDIFMALYLFWIVARHLASSDQILPRFSGWCVNIQNNFETLQKTILTYLPPINLPITEFGTVYKLFEILQSQAKKVNMPYVNITLDVGAAINAHKVLWNYPSKFENIVIHLGDFHYTKEVFAVLGKIITGSGFEDIIFQSGICSVGSLNGVIAGSHYNRCWTVHAHLSEALERLLFQRFLTSVDAVPDVLTAKLQSKNADEEFLDTLMNDEKIGEFLSKFEQFKEEVRLGNHGKTSQFWLVYYLDIMYNQHLLHTAIQTNNFYLRIHGLKNMLPLMFALDKQNYARYGSCYVNTLENLDATHPGCRELLKYKGLSVQGQEKYPCRIAIDQRGEQTINRDAKVSGGIKYFASDPGAILKWTLNRSAQAKHTEALYNLADIKATDDIYKSNRPSQIMKSEEFVIKILNVLTKEYVNPFSDLVDCRNLYNLSSGIPLESALTEGILNVKEIGEQAYSDFVENRIKSTSLKIHDPIKRNKCTLFKNAGKTVVVKHDQKEKVIEINRNILGQLLASSAKSEKCIDFEKALTYPLSPIPLCFAHPDGSRRTTAKSQLMEVVLSYCSTSTDPKEFNVPKTSVSAYLIDLMAMIRTLPGLYDTYHKLALKLFDMLPKGYKRIDIVADTYRPKSLKDPERNKRGTSPKVMVQSAQSKIPRNFAQFLKNGDNKTRLIELIKDELIANKEEVLRKLHCETILFSMDKICYLITPVSVEIAADLSSNQEEADTKLLLHCKHALALESNKSVIVRSPSGDVDINILFLSIFKENVEQIYIDYGTGKARKVFKLGSIDMSDELKSALVGFHAFTGNDYVSSIFRKSKKACWKVLKKNNRFVRAFSSLGTTWEIDEELAILLEEYLCNLFGRKMKDINLVRYETFKNTYEKKGKIQDLALLPPCKQSFQLRCKRCAYVAKVWKSSLEANLEFEDIQKCGWNEDGEIIWVDKPFPEDVETILVNEDIDDISESEDSDSDTDGE